MSIIPLPTPVDDLIAIPLALAALILWLAVSVERRFHRWPWVTVGLMLLVSLLGVEQVWPLLAALASMVQRLLDALGPFGVLALLLALATLTWGLSAVRRRLQRRRRRRSPSDDQGSDSQRSSPRGR